MNPSLLRPVQLSTSSYKVSGAQLHNHRRPHHQHHGSAHSKNSATVALAHGFLGSGENWRSFAYQLSNSRAIAERFAQVEAVTMRNHGATEHTSRHTCALMASDLEHHGSIAGGAGSLLVAHSMSGYAAMHGMIRAANAHAYVARGGGSPSLGAQSVAEIIANGSSGAELSRGRLCGCVIVDIAPDPEPPVTLEAIRMDVAAMRRVEPGHFDSVDALVAALRSAGALSSDAELRQHAATNLARDAAGRLSWRSNLAALEADLDRIVLPDRADDVVVKVDVPTLFVFGGASPYNTVASRAHIGDFFSCAEQIEFAGCGHFVHLERRKELEKAIADFVSSLRARE